MYLPIVPRHLTTRTLCDTFNNATRYSDTKVISNVPTRPNAVFAVLQFQWVHVYSVIYSLQFVALKLNLSLNIRNDACL